MDHKSLFAHLHAHTQYSLLDSSNKIKNYLNRVKELGMNSAAITDHGVMYGVVDFYKYATSIGIHPIIGCEVYVSPDAMTQCNTAKTRYYHLVLLAENTIGYHNLLKLVSIGFTKGFYYRPRIDLEALNQYHAGIIALSGCLAGEIASELVRGNEKRAYMAAQRYWEIFGEHNFFLELQDHGIPAQKKVNEGLVQMNKKLGIPLVATNDIHYTYPDDADSHDILLCIQTQKKADDPNRMRYEGKEFYVKSEEEMKHLFSQTPDAILNTEKIAQRCQVEFTFGQYHLPKYTPPESNSSLQFLTKLCLTGLKKRYPTSWESLQDKMNYELHTIHTMGFVDYFLIVWDFIHYAKQNDIPVGPGRGSAAGSLIAYCLEITEIDPIKHNLLFERFLNPERITMPDIDIDFCMERRQEVIDYVTQKYGREKVAQIITFGTMAAKAAILGVGKVLDFSSSSLNKITKIIGTNPTIEEALLQVADLQQMYNQNPKIKKLIDTARKLEGLPHHISVHAAGLVICPQSVDSYVPLAISSDRNLITQYTMTTLEELGLLKVDFLGLRTLTVIHKSLNSIHNDNVSFAFDYNDPEVYQFIGTGQTEGIFQLESKGMQKFMQELKPKNLEDIIAGISLYRPGPIDFIPKYIKGKNNPNKITYVCKELQPILKDTYGCIIYQEQVMQIVQDLAGYSMGQADLIRRAMSKKKQSIIEEERKNFVYGNQEQHIIGCVANGIKESAANQIYDSMIDFAKYAFNKSHAAAYAVIAYQTAYLKCHYPVYYIAALMTSVKNDSVKTSQYLNLAKSLKIQIMKPDINTSFTDFLPQGGHSISYALSAIRDVGEACVKEIIEERQKSLFKSFDHFMQRITKIKNFDKKTMENLIKSGALDNFQKSRKELLQIYSDKCHNTTYAQKNAMMGQNTLFSLMSSSEKKTNGSKASEEFSFSELLAQEKEVLGIYLSGHPLDEYREQWKRSITAESIDFLNDNDSLKDGEGVVIGGILTDIVIKKMRSHTQMSYITIEDFYGSIEIIVFPLQYERYKSILISENSLLCFGTIKKDEKKISVIAKEFQPLTEITKELWIQFTDIEEYHTNYQQLMSVISQNKGNTQVILYLKNTRQMNRLSLEHSVSMTESFVSQLKTWFGERNIRIK